jgi:BolA protein
VTSETRVTKIRARLEEAFHPSQLQIIDESHLHAGHEGARSGKGHFRILIESEQFGGVRPLARHRLIHEALGSLMESDIHALSIVARAP